jgi:hypothetical protein
MKKIQILICLLVSLTSCTKETLTTTSELVPLSFNTNSSLTTKADPGLTSNTVGVYVLQTDASPASTLYTAPYQNVKYSVDASGVFSTTGSVLVSNINAYSAISYAPYKSVSDPAAVPFSYGEDVLYASPTTVSVGQTTASATLGYVHKMSRITFNLVSGSNGPDLTNAKLSVSGFYSSCTMNLADGSLIPIMGDGVIITDAGTPKFIVPGTMTLSIKVAVGTYAYTTSVIFKALSSNDYAYSITVNNNATTPLEVNCNVIPWNSINAGNL